MKKFLLLAALLLATSAHATLYKWNGTASDGTQVSGSFEENSNLLWSMDFNLGNDHYIFEPQYFPAFTPDGKIVLSDVPLTGPNTGDLQFNENSSEWWFDYGHGNGTEIGGNIASIFGHDVPSNDAAPTPEPSSFVLMGAALLGFFLLSWRRRSRSA